MNIVPASLGKRTGAAILDIFVSALLWFGLLAYAVQPIFNSLYGTYAIQEKYQEIEVASHLYSLDADYGTVSVLDAADYPAGVEAFYLVYKPSHDFTNKWYNETILKVGETDSLFEYQLTDGVVDPTLAAVAKATATSDQLSAFYSSAYANATAELSEASVSEKVASHLYVLSGTEAVAIGPSGYASGLLDYYTSYKPSILYTVEWYNTKILLIGTASSLFETTDIENVVGKAKAVADSSSMTSAELSSAQTVLSSSLTTFWSGSYTDAVSVLNAQEDYLAIANELSMYFTWEVAIVTAVVLLVFYLLVPLLLKDGRTLGKKLFGIAITNKLGYKVTPLQVVIRFLAFGIIEVVGSAYTLMGTILISYTLMIFSKKNITVHDFLASTRAIDAKHSVWFKNATEAAAYQAEVDAASAKLQAASANNAPAVSAIADQIGSAKAIESGKTETNPDNPSETGENKQ